MSLAKYLRMPYLLALGIWLVALGIGVGLELGARIEYPLLDWNLRWLAARSPPDPDIVLLDIDEPTLEGLAPDYGRYPWTRAVYGQLNQAAAVLAETGNASADAVEAGAFAMAAGLAVSDIADIARIADRAHPAATALQVAGTLTALGVPRAETVSLVRTTIRSGRPVGELVSLPGQVQAAMAGGAPPAAAAAGLERAAAAHLVPRPRGQGKGQGNPHKP